MAKRGKTVRKNQKRNNKTMRKQKNRINKTGRKRPKALNGSRREVMNGSAEKTSGGLRKKDLMYNKQRRIVSRKLHKLAKKQKHLKDFTTVKGKFGAFKKGPNGKLIPVYKKRN